MAGKRPRKRLKRARRKSDVPVGDRPGTHISYIGALKELADISRKQIATLMPHHGERGRIAEEVFRSMLAKILPRRFSIGSGVIINLKGQASTQQDIIIYDHERNAPILSDFSAGIFPVECVYATVEVKSSLTKKEILNAFKSIGRLRSIGGEKEYIGKWVPVQSGTGSIPQPEIRMSEIKPRTYIFAFGSPLSPETMLSYAKSQILSTGAHIHGAVVLDRDIYFATLAHRNPPDLQVVRQNALARFFKGMLVGLSTAELGEMNFLGYLREPNENVGLQASDE